MTIAFCSQALKVNDIVECKWYTLQNIQCIFKGSDLVNILYPQSLKRGRA